MSSSDQLKSIIFVWSVFGLLAGLSFAKGETHIEDVLLAVLMLSSVLTTTWLIVRQPPTQPNSTP